MKKILKIVAMLLAIPMMFGAVACGGTPPPPADAEYEVNYSALDKNASGTIKVMRPANVIEDSILDAWIAGFKAEYPNVTVIKTNVEISSYSASVKMQFQANALADIIWCNSTNMYDLVANDIALNLDGFMSDTEDATGFDWKFDDKEDDFTDEFNMMGMYDGSRYAIPRAIDSVVCYYMKDTVAAAGVNMTQYKDGWTMEQFKTEAIKVREYFVNEGYSNYYPLDPYLEWESVAWPIVKSLGGEFIGSDGEFALTETKANEVHAFVNDFIDNGIVAPYGAFAGSNFLGGTGAFMWQSSTVGDFQENITLKDKFDVVPFPTIGDNPAVGMGFAGYAINSKVANDQNKLNLVSAFMAYLMSYDGQQKLAYDIESGGAGLDAVSIRADLGIDNTDANWHKRYNNFNMAAYVANSQYKVGVEFLGYNATYSKDIIGALNAYVGDYCKRKTNSEAYAMLQEDMYDIFNSI